MIDVTTLCDVNTCKECPRYGDDCDGDKRLYTHEEAWGMSDLISRADAIEAVKHSTAYMHDDLYEAISRIPSAETTGALDDAIAKYVADGLMELPSAEAEWIPCSERLPSEGEQVIISVCDDGGDTPYWYTAVGWRCEKWWISDNDYVIGVVTAWKPLPKPWKGEDDE